MKNSKVLLFIGNFTFNHFTVEELVLFKTPIAHSKALVHDITCIIECDSVEQAEILGEEALEHCSESYLIPSIFEEGYTDPDGLNYGGEVVYECENNLLPISVENFKEDYLK